jgi:hypothetical protein
MNLLLLLLAAAAVLPIGPAARPWVPVVALSILSLQMQLITVTRTGALTSLTWVNAGLVTLLLLSPVSRGRMRAWIGALATDIVATCRTGIRDVRELDRLPRIISSLTLIFVAVFIVLWALLFVPETPDPYHLMKVVNIERTGTLAYVPAADLKINVLSHLYELLLADARQIPLIGTFWLNGQGLLLFVIYGLAAIALMRQPLQHQPSVPPWLFLLAIPALFHQFMLINNDILAFGLSLAALLLLQKGASGDSSALLIGWLGGLACAVKPTCFPIALAAMVFAPEPGRFGSLRLRLVAAAGIIIGAVAGGVLFHLWSNANVYGFALQAYESLGNRTTTLRGSIKSVTRFVLSLADGGLLTRRIWPGRGGWGGNLGWVVSVSILLLALRSVRELPARRALALCATTLLAFAAVYPDADVAHRMVLGPGVFAVVQAMTGARSTDQWRLTKTTTAVTTGLLPLAFVGCLAVIGWSGTQYLRQIQYLRLPEAVARRAPSIRKHPVWRMRELNVVARQYERVAITVQEDRLILDGVPYTQALVLQNPAQGHQGTWDLKALATADLIVIGPNQGPDNREATRLVNLCLPPSDQLATLSGVEMPLAAVDCTRRRLISFGEN